MLGSRPNSVTRSTPPPTKSTTLFVLALSAVLLSSMADTLRGPLVPLIMSDLHLTDRGNGVFYGLASLGGLTASLSLGWLPWLNSPTRVMRSAAVILLCAVLVLSSARSTAVLYGAALALGISMASMNVSSTVVVNLASPVQKRGRYLSIHALMYGLMSIAVPLTAGAFANGLGWRRLMLLPALGLVVFLYCARHAKDAPAPPVFQANTPGASVEAVFWLTLLVVGLYVGAEVGTSAWLVRCWIGQGAHYGRATSALTLFFAALSAGRILASALADRWQQVGPIALCLALSTVCLAAGVLHHLLWFSLSGLFMGPVVPLILALLSRRWPAQQGSVTAFTLASFSLFIAATHFGMGLWADLSGSVLKAFWIPVGLMALAWGLALGLALRATTATPG